MKRIMAIILVVALIVSTLWMPVKSQAEISETIQCAAENHERVTDMEYQEGTLSDISMDLENVPYENLEPEQKQIPCCDDQTEAAPQLLKNMEMLNAELFNSAISAKSKRKKAALEGYSESQYNTVGGSVCPSKGNVNVLVVMVNFADVRFQENITEDYISQMFFGEQDENSPYYPKESVSAWYQRSSYGKLNLSGTVKTITMSKNREEYTAKDVNSDGVISAEEDYEIGYQRELGEKLKEMDVNWSDYDLDQDGYIDEVFFLPAGETGSWGSQWWSKRNSGTLADLGEKALGEQYSLGQYIQIVGKDIENYVYGVSVACHELGHGLGLPDLYSTDSEDGAMTYGIHTTDMMSNDTGDHNAFSKMLLGWLEPDRIHLIAYGSGEQEIEMRGISSSGECAIMFLDENTSVFGEYYLAEYQNFTGNNSELANWAGDNHLKIFHVDASMENDSLKNNNASHDNHLLIEAVDRDAEYIHLSSFNTNINSAEKTNIWKAAEEYHCGFLQGDEFTPYSTPSTGKYSSDGKRNSARLFSGLNLTDISTQDERVSFRAFYENEAKENMPVEFSFRNIGSSSLKSDYSQCSIENLVVPLRSNRDLWISDGDISAYIRKKDGEKVDGIKVNVDLEHIFNGYAEQYSVSTARNALVISLEGILEKNTDYEVVFPAEMFVTSYGRLSNEIILGGIHTMSDDIWDTEKINYLHDSNKYYSFSSDYIIDQNNHLQQAAVGKDGALFLVTWDIREGTVLEETCISNEQAGQGHVYSFGQTPNGKYWIDTIRNNTEYLYIVDENKNILQSFCLSEMLQGNYVFSKSNLIGDGNVLLFSEGTRSACYIDMQNNSIEVCAANNSEDGEDSFRQRKFYLENDKYLTVYKSMDSEGYYCRIQDKLGSVLQNLNLNMLIDDVYKNSEDFVLIGTADKNIVIYKLSDRYETVGYQVLISNALLRKCIKLQTGYLVKYYSYEFGEERCGLYDKNFHLDSFIKMDGIPYYEGNKEYLLNPSYGVSDEIMIETKEHQVVTDAGKPASCTETGLTEGSHCKVCGAILKEQKEIAKTEHIWDDGTVDIEATQTREGCITYLCKVCGAQKSEIIPILPSTNTDEQMTVSAPDVTATYDGQPHGIAVNVSNPTSGYTIKYGNDAENCTLDASPTITNVSDSGKVVYFQVTADNYETYTGSAVITINPKAVSRPTIELSQTSYVYDGNAKAPVVTVKDGETEIPSGEYTVGWMDNTSVGTAIVTITDKLGGNYTVSGSATFQIEKANPVIGTVSANELENSLDTSDVILSRTDETIPGTLALAADTKLNWGTHTYNYVFTPDDSANYNIVTGTVSITIKDTIAPTGKIEIKNSVWNTFEDALSFVTFGWYKPSETVTVTAEDSGSGVDQIYYYVYEPQTGVTTGLTQEQAAGSGITWTKYEGSFSIGKDTKCGIYVKITDKGNPTNTRYLSAGPLGFDSKAPVINGVENGKKYVYGTDRSISVTDAGGELDSVTINGISETIVGNAVNKTVNAVGSYIIRAKDKAGNESTLSFEIMKAELALTASITGWNYGDSPNSVLVGGNAGNGSKTITYKGKGAADSTYTTTVPTDAGDYTVRVSVAETKNYKAGITTVDFTISKVAATVLSAPQGVDGLKWNGTAKPLVTAGGTNDGILVYSLSASGAFTEQIPIGTDAKDYAVYYKVTGDKNHLESAVAGPINVSIAKGMDPAVVADTATVREGGQTVDLSKCVSGALGNVSYAITGALEGCSVDGTTGIFKSGVQTGDCTVTVTIEESANCESKTAEIKVSVVNKLTADLDVTQEGSVYGGSTLKAPSYHIRGSAENPADGSVTITYTGTLRKDGSEYSSTAAPTEAGSYSVSVIYVNDTTIYSGSAAFTISPADIGDAIVMLSEGSLGYTGSEQTKTVLKVELGGIEIPSADYLVSGNTGTNAGAYTITVTAKTESNYIGTVTREFAIAKVEPHIQTAPNASQITYGQVLRDSSLTGGAVQHSSSDTTEVNGTFAWKEPDIKPTVSDSGQTEYAVVFAPTGADAVNYECIETNVRLSVTKAEHAAVTTSGIEVVAGEHSVRVNLKPYLEKEASISIKEKQGELSSGIENMALNGNVLTFDVADSAENEKTGTIIVDVDGPNYNLYTISVPVTVRAQSTQVVFGEDDGTETSVSGVSSSNLSEFTEKQTGTTVKVILDVEVKRENSLENTVKEKIESELEKIFSDVENTSIKKEFLDMNVTKSVNGGSAEKIDDVEKVLEIEVSIDLTGKYNPVVIREHKGTILKFSELSERPAAGNYKDGTFYADKTYNKVYIYTEFFSTYSIAYADIPSYQVTFDNGGTKTQVIVKDGGKVTKPTDPIKSGYSFNGWYNGDTAWNFSDDTVSADLTLTAKWTKKDDISSSGNDDGSGNSGGSDSSGSGSSGSGSGGSGSGGSGSGGSGGGSSKEEITSSPTPVGTTLPTEMPDSTVVPTKQPVATSAPDRTAAPVVTSKPENTSVPTVTPGSTSAPINNKRPAAKGTVLINAGKTASYIVTSANQKKPTVAYKNCKNKKVKTVTVPTTVKINGVSYVVTSVSAEAFKNHKTLTKVTVGNNIRMIGKKAFYGCKKLKTVCLGKNVKKIGAKAFYGCEKLKQIEIKTKVLQAKNIGVGAFQRISKNVKVIVPKGCKGKYWKILRKKGIGRKRDRIMESIS